MVSVQEPREVSDSDLMVGIIQGDLDAFEGLFNRYLPTAMALAQRILRQGQMAEESVQEAFLAVWRDPQKYRAERGTVRSWLLTTVHNRAVDHVRREQSQRARAAAASALGSADELPADPGEVVVRAIGLVKLQRAVRRALEGLRPERRQIIELMYFGGLTQSQISDQLSLPLGTVKSRTLLGMRHLWATLGGDVTINVHDR